MSVVESLAAAGTSRSDAKCCSVFPQSRTQQGCFCKTWRLRKEGCQTTKKKKKKKSCWCEESQKRLESACEAGQLVLPICSAGSLHSHTPSSIILQIRNCNSFFPGSKGMCSVGCSVSRLASDLPSGPAAQCWCLPHLTCPSGDCPSPGCERTDLLGETSPGVCFEAASDHSSECIVLGFQGQIKLDSSPKEGAAPGAA